MKQIKDKYSKSEQRNMQIGSSGKVILSSGKSVSGKYYKITVLQPTIFGNIEFKHCANRDGVEVWHNLTFPAGLTFYGDFEEITVNSGSIIAYKGK